jgi:hypothetical protein
MAAAPPDLPPRLESAGRRLVDLLRAEALNYLAADRLPDIRLEGARFTALIDPANGLPGYEGVWRNHLNERVGRIIFNSDGSFYAEYDLCVRHPTRPHWFVEAVTAWGSKGQVKGEARLIPMV